MVVNLTVDRQGESSIVVNKGLCSGVCDALSKQCQSDIVYGPFLTDRLRQCSDAHARELQLGQQMELEE